MTYTEVERRRAVAWKSWSPSLPAAARRPAPYVGKGDGAAGPAYEFCLPPEHAELNLLPEVRTEALELFAELGIPWHAGVQGGPSNHLLSSQVQCVNALGQMVSDPDRLRRAFADALGTEEVLQVEPGRWLTFEYTGPTDYFGEAPGGRRVRGAHCTSVDAAFLHRTTDGITELVLLEWKYTEQYRPRRPEPAKDAVRWQRYGAAWSDPAGPVADALPFADVLDEPLYQLVRQQLLAHELEKAHVLGADRVRVVHVSPPANDAYQSSLLPAHRALGDSVSEVWRRLLRAPDRFVSLDSALFCDTSLTSREYVVRYGEDVAHDEAGLLALLGAGTLEEVDDMVFAATDFDGDLRRLDDGLELYLSGTGYGLEYPVQWSDVLSTADQLQEEVCERLEEQARLSDELE